MCLTSDYLRRRRSSEHHCLSTSGVFSASPCLDNIRTTTWSVLRLFWPCLSLLVQAGTQSNIWWIFYHQLSSDRSGQRRSWNYDIVQFCSWIIKIKFVNFYRIDNHPVMKKVWYFLSWSMKAMRRILTGGRMEERRILRKVFLINTSNHFPSHKQHSVLLAGSNK